MFKKLSSLVLSIVIALTSVSFVFATYTVDESRVARVNDTYDYLNEVYLTNDELAFDIDYVSDEDLEILTKLAYYITDGCTNDYDKAMAIYNWIHENVTYKNAYSDRFYTAIDCFRTGAGFCSGHSQLASTLLRILGIRCAIVRGNKMNGTTNCGAHEWTMVYIAPEWYLFDDLWAKYCISDREKIAYEYKFEHVDGVIPSGNDVYSSKAPFTYYVDGQYVCYVKGELSTMYGNSAVSVGGCLRYFSQYTNGIVSTFGENFTYGLFPYYVKSNGILTEAKLTGNIMYNESCGFYIDESFDNNGLTNGHINMYIGETMDLNEYYPGYSFSSVNKVSITDGILTTTETGFTEIRVAKNGIGFWLPIYVYGDVIESNELFQSLCDHDCTHCVLGEEYCDYCGLHIETVEEPETVEETPVEEETIIEENPTEEIIEEETTEVEAEIVEETITKEEAVEEESTEEVIEETIVEEIIEEEVTETVEETIPEQVQEEVAEEEIIPEQVYEEPIIEEEVIEPVEEEIVEITEIEPAKLEVPVVSEVATPTELSEIIETVEETIIEETSVIEEQIIEEVIEPAVISQEVPEVTCPPTYTSYSVPTYFEPVAVIKNASVNPITATAKNVNLIWSNNKSKKLLNNTNSDYDIPMNIQCEDGIDVEELFRNELIINFLMDIINSMIADGETDLTLDIIITRNYD